MEKNKITIRLCYIELIIFAGILVTMIFHFRCGFEKSFFALMIIAALVGCGVSLALKDYLKSMIQSSAFDVAGVHNKKALEKQLQQIQDEDDTLDTGIMMFDLNNLKIINDTYGHEEGDVFIQTFASFLTRILTENSYLARFGGDEFLIIQRNTTWSQLEQMNIQLQTLIDEHNQTADHPLSYAVGYDISCKNHYYLIMDLLKIADEKMYQDKKYKKQQLAQKEQYLTRSGLAQSISSDSLKEKIFTILTNANGEKEYAFIMTDISKFHLINDYWGYETGTKILNFVLRRMELFSAPLFVNRYHSDVFVAVLDITGRKSSDVKKQIEEYNRQIIQEILKTFQINYFHLNTGIYYLKDTSIPAEQIISHTNIVREKAKTELSGVCEYTNDIALNEQHCADTIHSFKSALKQKEFKIYFQPKMCGKDQTIASAEALVRWQRENDTMWYPDMFLPILEETGEIQALDYYVYEETFAWMNQRRKEGKRVIPVSLNVSPVHFGNIHSFAEKVMALVKQYEINPYYVIFEITETTFIHNIKAVNEMIRFFHEQNIRISMDDFGSGYSSLNALKDILFDEVKIDKRFLSDELSENGKIVLQEIFHLLKRTNKSIVCEGVETKEMVDFLVEEGCDELQGYYYYKPMSQNAFEKLLDSIFKTTALDVSSDISVLNTLLAQEGLTDDELTRLRKEREL